MKFPTATVAVAVVAMGMVLCGGTAAAQSTAPARPGADQPPCVPGGAARACPGAEPTARSGATAVQAAGAKSGGSDNAPAIGAIMALLGPGRAGPHGYSVLFPQDPGQSVTQYYFSAPLALTRSGTIACDGGAGFRTHSIHLVFAAGQDGVVWEGSASGNGYSQAELQGCGIYSLGAGRAGSVIAGSGTIARISMFSDGAIKAPFFAPGDGIMVAPSSGNASPAAPVSVPNGTTVGSVTGAALTLAGGATVSVGGVTPAYVYRLPAALADRATMTKGSATVTITGGTTRFHSGDMVWVAGFPFGTRVITASGATGSQTLVMNNIFLTADQPADRSLADTPIWRVPAGLRRRQQGYARANYVFGFPVSLDIACSSTGALNCTVSNDELNGFEYGIIGRATAGNNSGGSTSQANEYGDFMLADILEGGSIGSTYISDNSNSGSRSSAWPIIGNCANQNYSLFVGGYVDDGYGGWDYCIAGRGVPPQFVNPVAGYPYDAATSIGPIFNPSYSGGRNITPYTFPSAAASPIAAATYDRAAGTVTITTREPLNIPAGRRFSLYGLTGADDAQFSLRGPQTAIAGSGGATIVFSAGKGRAWTITAGFVALRDNMPCVTISGEWYSFAVSKDCATPNRIGLQYQPRTDAWDWVGAGSTPLLGFTGPAASRPWLPYVPGGALLLGDLTNGRTLSYGAGAPAGGVSGDIRFNNSPADAASPLGWRNVGGRWSAFYGSSGVGSAGVDAGGAAAFAVGSAAGPGATATCAAGHVCDGLSGTVTLTLGARPAVGSLMTITFPNTRANLPNCALSGVDGGQVGPAYTRSTMTLSTKAAQAARDVLTIGYVCGGN